MNQSQKEYPLKCYSRFANDDFSGWYSVSNEAQCNDFCFWSSRLPKNGDENGNENRNTSDTRVRFSDPRHGTTDKYDDSSVWGCVSDATGTPFTEAMDRFQKHGGETFDYLRCEFGAEEVISSRGQRWIQSAALWWILLSLGFLFLILETMYFLRRKTRRGITCNSSRREAEIIAQRVDFDDEDTLQPVREGEDEHSRVCRLLKRPIRELCLTMLFFLLNLFFLYVMFTSFLSILEITYQKDLRHFALKAMTPACTPDTLCKRGNVDVDNPSSPHQPPSSTYFRPFSYMIASDSQSNWYDGESRHVGKLNYPPPCTSDDSCDSCTSKLGRRTNAQIKLAMENLVRGEYTDSSDGDRPVPKTLVMNGDLTAYFHRDERRTYERFFHDVRGLEQYFPGLGNHDYSHYGGGGYNGDEWIGPLHCNANHAVGYLKSGFCQKIPGFDAAGRVTRYDSRSLAYSWERGPYHFVQLHYYPTYESAGVGVRSSAEWLERDLELATASNLTSVVFVHSAGHLVESVKETFVRNGVAAIFAGHLHRCFGRKCAGWTVLRREEADGIVNGTEPLPAGGVEKCFPAGAAMCSGGSVDRTLTWNVFSLEDADEDLTLPNVKLHNRFRRPEEEDDDGADTCPVYDTSKYINTTDNTLLCKKSVFLEPYVSSSRASPSNHTEARSDGGGSVVVKDKTVPVFWSGSSSFETFVRADFYEDRLVIDFITAAEGSEGARYVDVHEVPNAVYPFHDKTDLEEVTIYI